MSATGKQDQPGTLGGHEKLAAELTLASATTRFVGPLRKSMTGVLGAGSLIATADWLARGGERCVSLREGKLAGADVELFGEPGEALPFVFVDTKHALHAWSLDTRSGSASPKGDAWIVATADQEYAGA